MYLEEDRGKLACDGNVLDFPLGNGLIASRAWHTPACGSCWRPEYWYLVPWEWLTCRDHGRPMFPQVDPWPMSEEEKARAERRAWRKIADDPRIPLRYRNVSFETSRPTPAILAMQTFISPEDDDETGCLVLAGPTGVGKTLALVAGFRHAAVWDGNDSHVFYSFPVLVRKFLGEESQQTLEECVRADCLWVDDAGGSYLKEGGVAEALFEELVITREAEERRMAMTTNLTLSAFAEAFGDRIMDRIRGPWGLWVSLPGQSLRRKPRPRTEVKA